MIYSEEKDGADSLGEIMVAVHFGGHERELRARNGVVVCASLPLERGLAVKEQAKYIAEGCGLFSIECVPGIFFI